MELTLILGANGSGKSAFAETLAVEKSGKRYYIAAMQPQSEDDHRRIEKHRAQRAGKDFETIELAADVSRARIEKKSVVLLEDVSNLLANRMFGTDGDALTDTLNDILALGEKCASLIAVSISGLDETEYSGETAEYIRALNILNDEFGKKADAVYIMQDGKAKKVPAVGGELT